MNQSIEMITLPAAELLRGASARALAAALLAKLSQENAIQSAAIDSRIPNIGESWPGQGGINAGLVRGEDGGPDYYLIVHGAERTDVNWNDAMAWAKTLEADGHKDFQPRAPMKRQRLSSWKSSVGVSIQPARNVAILTFIK